MVDDEKPPIDHHKYTRIVVNRDEHSVEGDHVSYKQIVELAGYQLSSSGEITVRYRNALNRKPEGKGTLHKGQTVKVQDGTSFIVAVPDRT